MQVSFKDAGSTGYLSGRTGAQGKLQVCNVGLEKQKEATVCCVTVLPFETSHRLMSRAMKAATLRAITGRNWPVHRLTTCRVISSLPCEGKGDSGRLRERDALGSPAPRDAASVMVMGRTQNIGAHVHQPFCTLLTTASLLQRHLPCACFLGGNRAAAR